MKCVVDLVSEAIPVVFCCVDHGVVDGPTFAVHDDDFGGLTRGDGAESFAVAGSGCAVVGGSSPEVPMLLAAVYA